MPRILVVDDEPAIQSTLRDILVSTGHEVFVAEDGLAGLERVQADEYDLVISDISMPRMNGIEFLSRLGRIAPKTHRILLTAHTLEEYIDQLVQHDLSCVLTKSIPFPVGEVVGTVDALISRKIFGLDRLVPNIHSRESFQVRTHEQLLLACDRLAEFAPEKRRNHLNTVLNEILTNAVYYGALDLPGDHKETWSHDFVIPEDKAVWIELAVGDDRRGISISDAGGKLKRQTVLHWLHRQMAHDENGLPLGIFDNHGRGFFISRSFSDRLSISIERGKRCEVSLVLYDEAPPAGEKPLVILEI
jgi:CheY-like chemotaxis protein